MADLISAMQAIYTFMITQFAKVFGVITDNPVLFLPVLLGFLAAIVLFVVSISKSFIRGRGGRRRRRG